MQNMMNDLWKNVDVMKAFDFTKSFDLTNGIDPSSIGLQVIGFQRDAFNKTYDLLLNFQEQSEKIVDLLMKSPGIPDEGRKMLDEWRLAFKNHRDEMKKSIDDNFIMAESFFAKAAAPPKTQTSEPLQKKASEPKKEESEPKKEMAKSTQENSGPKKEAVEKEKPVKEPQAKKEK